MNRPHSGRFVCIHGHFYQPPRENPWLEEVELQDSAHPYHDWNARVSAECYAPNAASRILDARNRIEKIVNNYARVSFDVGPTLLSWLARKDPDTYEAILSADRTSRERFSGHGNAIAQAYNHAILPLATRRDKETQVRWGIRDFEFRFGRKPEGMWLPETAVDEESLDVLAQCGIQFTILAPHQARRIRRIGETEWEDAAAGTIDPTRAYRAPLASGRSIALFFYDGAVSRAVAFEQILHKGDFLAGRLLSAFSETRPHAQLVHIATDGESYGHHHRHGDMALAFALESIEQSPDATLTNYGEYLARHPPEFEVQINPNTSWSCEHGLGRWKSDCGCRSGAGTTQTWRAPLRAALDWLRDELAPRYQERAASSLRDPWSARDAYIDVILDRSAESVDAFIRAHSTHELSPAERIETLRLLELQRHAQLMYTSCGWFFDDLAGIETRQVIQYAGRSIQLSETLFGSGLENGFLEHLALAQSGAPPQSDGRAIYENSVRPAMVTLDRVGAHYAVSSLFESYGTRASIYCYTVDREDYHLLPGGRARLVLGRARVTSNITEESARVAFGVLHLGGHNLNGGVGSGLDDATYEKIAAEISDKFTEGDLAETLLRVDRHFSSGAYSLTFLFRDERRRILHLLLNSALEEIENAYQHLYDEHAPITRFLSRQGITPPAPFRIAAEAALTSRLRRELEEIEPDLPRLASLLEEARRAGIALPENGLGFAFKNAAARLAAQLRNSPRDGSILETLEAFVALLRTLPFDIDLWAPQNVCYALREAELPGARDRAAGGDLAARTWVARFEALEESLGFRAA